MSNKSSQNGQGIEQEVDFHLYIHLNLLNPVKVKIVIVKNMTIGLQHKYLEDLFKVPRGLTNIESQPNLGREGNRLFLLGKVLSAKLPFSLDQKLKRL